MISEPTSATNPQILIAESAVELIEHEARLASATETGGILVGRRLDETRILVLAATKPGPNSDRRQTTFAPDVQYVEQQLKASRQQYPGVDYVGTWHKHPPSFDRPSDGDWKQAQEVLTDPDYAVNELVAPIVVVRNDVVSMKVYYLHRQKMHEDFIQVVHTPIPDSEANTLLQDSRRANGQRYVDRLSEELQRLQGKYKVGKPQRLEDGSMVFTVQEAEGTIYLVCSPLYPQAAPRVMLEGIDGQQQEVASKVIPNWTRKHYLVEVVDEVIAQLRPNASQPPDSPPPETIPSRPKPLSEPAPHQYNGLWTILVGVVIVVFLCVVGSILLRPVLFPAKETPTTSTVAPATPVPAKSPTATPAMAEIVPGTIVDPKDAMMVIANWRYSDSESRNLCMLNLAIQGGQAPYTCRVDGQDVDCGNDFVRECACEQGNITVSYEVSSADGQRVGPNDASYALPACTPTPTPTPTPTSTPTPIPTPTDTPTPTPSTQPSVDMFNVVEPLKAYRTDGAPLLETPLVRGRTDCFTMRYAIQNTGAASVSLRMAGFAVFREGEHLDRMYFQGVPARTVLNPGESTEVNVAVQSGIICGMDLFEPNASTKGEAIRYHHITYTDTLTLVPAIQVSWPDVTECGSDQCPWYPDLPNGGMLTIQYQP